MARSYVKVYYDLIDSLTALSDTERGRILTAMLEYAGRGVEPDLRGNERFIWPQVKGQIDRDNDRYNAKVEQCREAGCQGGKANASGRKRTLTDATKTKRTLADANQDQDQDKDEDQDQDKDEERGTPKGVPSARKARFSPPMVNEVSEYCRERGNTVNAQQFVDFYASKGWKIGANPMKDWRAAVRTWEHRDVPTSTACAPSSSKAHYNPFVEMAREG